MSHLMTCVDAPNCTWADLDMPIIAGVNCAKHWEESIKQYNEDSMKKSTRKKQLMKACPIPIPGRRSI